MSAAIITKSAASISSAVNWFLAPTEPRVSTLTSYPRRFASVSNASAAIKVCATPVGHAVIATIFCLLELGVVTTLSATNSCA